MKFRILIPIFIICNIFNTVNAADEPIKTVYKSKEGCKVETFLNYDNDYIVNFRSANDHLPYTYTYIKLNKEKTEALSGPGLCGDDEGLPVAQVKNNNGNLEIGCGGRDEVIDVNLKLNFSKTGVLQSLLYKNKVALFQSEFTSLFSKIEKDNLKCSEFKIVDEDFNDE